MSTNQMSIQNSIIDYVDNNVSVCNSVIGSLSDVASSSSYNVVVGCANVADGDRNIILGNSNIVKGSGNIVVAHNQTIVGDNQIIIHSIVKTTELMYTNDLSVTDISNYCASTINDTLKQLVSLQTNL